jgi:hypothetical protein
MAFVNAGIKEVYFAKGDSVGILASDCFGASRIHKDSTPGDPEDTIYGLGIRQAGNFTGAPFNEIRDKDNRAFSNLYNFNASFSTMQVDLNLVQALVEFAGDSSVATAILTRGLVATNQSTYQDVSSASPHGGVFIFNTKTTDQGLGMDFELNISQTDRIMNMTFERAFDPADAVTLVTAAQDSANAVLLGVDTLPQIIPEDVMTGYITPADMILEMPDTDDTGLRSAFGLDANLAEFNAILRTKSTKNGYNKSIISGFEVELSATASGPDVNALVDSIPIIFPNAAQGTNGDVSFLIRANESLVFKTLGITQMASFDLGDENRTVKVDMTGTYDLDFVVTTATAITFNTFMQQAT